MIIPRSAQLTVKRNWAFDRSSRRISSSVTGEALATGRSRPIQKYIEDYETRLKGLPSLSTPAR
jgi:hypothetical protein